MSEHTCPSCQRNLPSGLVWATLVSGQVPHECPNCRKPFRLTYVAKQRVAYLNVILILGLACLIGFGMFTTWASIVELALAYLAVVAVIAVVLPRLARYEKTSTPRH